MDIKQEVDYGGYAMVIADVGPSFGKVFLEVRQITGKSLKEVAELLKLPRPIVATGTKQDLMLQSKPLKNAGAKIIIELAPVR